MTVEYADSVVDSPVDSRSNQDGIDAATMAREKQVDRLAMLGASLERDFRDRANNRKTIEARWMEDLRLYNSVYDPKTLTEIVANKGSQVYLSVGRTKTDAVEAHLSNLLLPTDESNWDISASPMPEIQKLAGSTAQVAQTDQGHPVTAGDMAQAMRDEVDIAADGMRELIKDQFIECNYPEQARKTIHQYTVLGTGVMRGPIPKNKTRKKWAPIPNSNGIFAAQKMSDARPAIEHVDLWDFYPSVGIGDIGQSDGFFVRHWMSRQQIKDLQYDVDFFADQIALLLQQHKEAPRISDSTILQLRELNGETSVIQASFEVIEYNGPVDTDDLIAIGVEVPDDPLASYKASIFFIDGIPLKGAIDPMDEAMSTEFYVVQFARDDTTVWGKGVPRLMRTSVLLCNAVMRMMIDNAGLAVGGQLVYDVQAIAPADGEPRMTPRKVWFKTGTNEGPVANYFAIVEIPVQTEWLIPLFNLARLMLDEESALPLIAQGDQAEHVTKTKGGMSMLMDAASVVLRRSVVNFDDKITAPIVTAMYDWNMLYHPDPTLKGDFAVKARGASAMLERQAQMESFMQFYQAAEQNPMLKAITNWPGAMEEFVRLLSVNRASLLVAPEKAKAIIEKMLQQPQQPPPDPRVQAATITATSNEKIANVRGQATVQANQDQAQGRIQAAQVTGNAAVQVAGIQKTVDDADIQVKIQALAHDANIDAVTLTHMMNEHADELGMKKATLDSENLRFNAEAHLKATTGSGVSQ